MNKEFIPYEQALELKKLGFNEPCFGEWQNLKIGKNLVVDEEDRIYDISVLGADIKAPLYQQAFKWFREKHNIRIGINYQSTEENGYYYSISWQLLASGENPPVMVWHNRNSWLGANEPLTTYEEAELACIKKLIEIVKNK